MVASTCQKNKTVHPAAPVMTAAAKRKAGIKAKAPPKSKRVTKNQTIKELLARIDALENPDGEPFSKEPLVRTCQPLQIYLVLTTLSFSWGKIHRRTWKTFRPENLMFRQRSTPMTMFPPDENVLQAAVSRTHGESLNARSFDS